MDQNNDEKILTGKRSEEVQDIIDRMPTHWAAWVTAIVAVLMTVVIVMGFIIEFPDTVNGQISITSAKAPVRLVSVTAGRVHLLAANRKKVKKGSVIAYIDNGANYHDILRIDEVLRTPLQPNTALYLPESLLLGDLSTDYNNFSLSYEQYDLLRRSEIYTNMRKALGQQIMADSKVALNLGHELTLKDQMLKTTRERMIKDSILKSNGALSEEDFHSQRANYLSQEEAGVSLKSSHLSKISEMNKNRIEMARIDLEENETLRKAYLDLEAKRNVLLNSMRQWKEHFLLVAPISGELEYLGFWREDVFIQSAQEMFTILPERNKPFGEVYIPLLGAGKVKVGQLANIKLADFPYDEYGLIKGRVKSISKLTNKRSTSEGTTETYLVVVSFPNGLTTNYGKQLKLNFESKGSIEIITKQKRLIERLFDNLKSKTVK
nr:HlyD family efflux transporter periplasmic adaptor subunit [Prevotella sp.]